MTLFGVNLNRLPLNDMSVLTFEYCSSVVAYHVNVDRYLILLHFDSRYTLSDLFIIIFYN